MNNPKIVVPKIVVGCPVWNRAWALPQYLKALRDLEYPNKAFLFLEDNSTDDTLPILETFQGVCPNQTWITRAAIPDTAGHRRGEYGRDGYVRMAALRNRFLDLFLETDGDYLLSIDSDVIAPPDTVRRLLELMDGATIAGAALCNEAGKRLDGRTAGNFMVKQGEQIIHPDTYPLSGVMNVAVVGAVSLIPRQVIANGARYKPHKQGEDLGFADEAHKRGYRFLVDLDCKCDHRMVEFD